MEDNNADFIVELAKGRIERGVVHEPRQYFDVMHIGLADHLEVPSHPAVFRNGEQFPVKLTHMVASVGFDYTDPDAPALSAEEIMQFIGLRMMWNGQFYMNQQFLPVPIWSTEVTAAADYISRATSCWKHEPFMLASRDTMVVRLQPIVPADPGETLPVTVTFTGIGALSGRPYFFSSTREMEGVAPATMNTEDFRNNGSEPVLIVDTTVNVGPDSGADDPVGNLRRVGLNIQQVNNGTGAAWFSGPTVPVPVTHMSSALLGVTSGRAVVHRFPYPITLEPGDGLEMYAKSLAPNGVGGADVDLLISMAGFIMVQ
jgi:hypothetical protein